MKNILNTISAVISDLIVYFWPLNSRRKIIRGAIFVLVVIGAVVFLTYGNNGEPEETSSVLPVVYVGNIHDVQGLAGTSFVGTVRAVSEAAIQAEVGGRVTSVRVEAGDKVAAGTILATLENASEQAAVLQAEGVYEAALAAASQSDVSVSDAGNTLMAAQNTAINTYRSAYNTANSVVLNTIDQFFTDPRSQTPGVRINAKTSSNTSFLNNSRVELKTSLPNWNTRALALDTNDDLQQELSKAKENISFVIRILDVLIDITSRAEINETLDGAAVTSYTTELTTARASLNTTLSGLDSARTGLISAQEALNRARLGGTEPEISSANAQVKQALGALRGAQANLAKTVFRSPINGVVNSININLGDYVSAMTQVAEVANNNALEVTFYVSEKEVINLNIGDEVILSNDDKGVITNIAPAIDPATLKIPVKVATESKKLVNGDTVTIRLEQTTSTETGSTLLVPLTAVKFTANDGVMFTVTEGKLVANPVELGSVRGSFVEVISGISADTEFVIDARGLSDGQSVEAQPYSL